MNKAIDLNDWSKENDQKIDEILANPTWENLDRLDLYLKNRNTIRKKGLQLITVRTKAVQS